MDCHLTSRSRKQSLSMDKPDLMTGYSLTQARTGSSVSIFQNNGSWEAHTTTGKKPLLPGLRKQIGMLSRLRYNTSQKVRLQLVNGLILSRLNYMICIWGNTSENTRSKAQVVLNSAARFVCGALKTTRISTLMTECNWMSIDELTTYFSLMCMWKTIWQKVPHYMTTENRN